jgi:hypothetical protein
LAQQKHILTVKIDDDTPIRDAASGVLEVGHSIREMHDRARTIAACISTVASVDDGVTEREDALEAAAQPEVSVKQEDSRHEEDSGQGIGILGHETPHLSNASSSILLDYSPELAS